jgi:hypothetical protein
MALLASTVVLLRKVEQPEGLLGWPVHSEASR